MRLVKLGKIKEISATLAEMESLRGVFDKGFVQGLGDGELEALALIKSNRIGDALFCTADAAAIRALAMLGHSDLGISMEILLKKTGLQKSLDKQFTDKFFRENRIVGQQNRITGQGLR